MSEDVMAAPKGNKFWMARSSHGRKPKFKSPDDLWNACKEYFEWVQANPLWEAKAFAYQGEVTIQKLPKMRAMTLDALCFFLDISHDTWMALRTRKGFVGVTQEAEHVIREQKFAGAAAELLNANIIARDLGLVDKQQQTVNVKTEADRLSALDEWVEGCIAVGERAEDPTTRTH